MISKKKSPSGDKRRSRHSFPRLGITGIVSLVTFRYAITFLQFGFLGLIIGGDYAFTNLSINTSTAEMLSRDLDFRQSDMVMKSALPAREDDLVVVIEGDSSSISHDAAARFVDKLKQYPALFDHILSASTDSFFTRNALLYLENDDVIKVTDNLIEGQPLLTTLYNDPSLRGLFRSFSLTLQAVEARAIPLEETPLIDKIFTAMSESLSRHSRKETAYISWREHISGKPETREERRVIIALKPMLDYESLRPAQRTISTLHAIRDEVAAQYDDSLTIGFTGSVMLEEEEKQAAVFGASLAGALAFILVGWLVIRGLGNWRLFLATMVTLLLGLAETAAFATWAVGQLNIISVAFAVLFIGIGVDFCIQFCLAFREALHKTNNDELAIIVAARKLRVPLLLAALAGTSGFLAFVPTSYVGLSELGIIAAGGLLIALINSFTLLPAFIRILSPTFGWVHDMKQRPIENMGFPLLAPIIIKHDTRILSIAGLCFLASIATFPNYHFDADPFNLRDPDSPSMRLARALIRSDNSEAYAASILTESPNEAQRVAHMMQKQDHVARAETPEAFLPRNVQPKLESVQDTALIILPSLTRAQQLDSETDQERLDHAIIFRNHLARFLATQRQETWPGARLLLNKLERLIPNDEASTRYLKNYAPIATKGLQRAVDLVHDSLLPDERLVAKNLAYLPESVKARYIDRSGRTLVTVYPHATAPNETAELANFTDSVRNKISYATGGSILMVEGGRTVIDAFEQAGLIAVLCVFLILLTSLRRGRDVLFVFMPLVLAACITIGVSVAIHIPLNYANLIALPLLFSLGVSYGIYLVWRWRAVNNVTTLINTATPRAIFYSAMTSIASFGSLAVSSHRGAASMGIMLFVALSLAIIASLVLLPALMNIHDRWQAIKKSPKGRKQSRWENFQQLIQPPQKKKKANR